MPAHTRMNGRVNWAGLQPEATKSCAELVHTSRMSLAGPKGARRFGVLIDRAKTEPADRA
jgi:hypothetical protein